MIANLVRATMRAAGLAEVAALRTGGANLLDRDESLLVARDRLRVGDLTVETAPRNLLVDRPLASILILLVLPLLLLEWWWFRRRPRLVAR
jgi:hypothetical protein